MKFNHYYFLLCFIGGGLVSHQGKAMPWSYGTRVKCIIEPIAASALLIKADKEPLSAKTALPPLTPKEEAAAKKKEKAAALRYKTMRREAMVQHAWISSMVIPGLGQFYNKDYWKIPIIYGIGGGLLKLIHSQHEEMHAFRRKGLMNFKQTSPSKEYFKTRQEECKRARNIYIIFLGVIYLLNILDGYAKAHDKMVHFTDDIGTTVTPPASPLPQATAATTATIGFSIPIYF